MKNIIKSMFIFYILIVTLLIGGKAKADTISTESLNYYFTFINDNNRNFSDIATIYYVDGRVTYCIEPGVKIGSTYDDIGTLDYLDETIRNKILNYMYYGYMFKGHEDKKYYMATQALIWEELLANPQEVVYSTQVFKQGEILDITDYKNDIINTISKYVDGIVYSSGARYKIYLGDYISIPDYNNLYNDYDVIYDDTIMKLNRSGNRINIDEFYTTGIQSITLREKDAYDTSYKVLKHDTKQDLLVVGNIPHKDLFIEFNVVGGTINIHKTDLEGNDLKDATYGLYDNNDNLVKEFTTDENGSYTIDTLPLGLYYIKELNAPVGYEINDDISYIEIKKHNLTINLELQDKEIIGELIINKMDKDSLTPIDNTIFTIKDEENNIIDEIKTNEDGKACIKLKYGKYTYQETKSNDNYQLDDTIYDIFIDESNNYIRTLYNERIEEELITEDELVILNVPNTYQISLIPLLCLIGAIIIEEKYF